MSKPKGFPTKIRLLGQTWEVVYTTQIEKDEHLLGCCEGDKRLIMIDTTQSLESMKDTLVHEIYHAACRMLPVHNSEEQEEAAATVFATIFTSLVRDNAPFWEDE